MHMQQHVGSISVFSAVSQLLFQGVGIPQPHPLFDDAKLVHNKTTV